MELGNLSGLYWGLLAVPIVIFYVLKIRLRRVPVSTVMFWNQIFDERRPRTLWQRLRHLLSLLVQLAFLVLVVGALVDPSFSWERLRARRIVLVVDNSASMRATDGRPTRLAEAKAATHRLIRGLRVRDQMAVLAAGGVPAVQCGLTGHQRTLGQAVDAIPATDAPTRVGEAVQLARRLLADHQNAKVIVLSDGCFSEVGTLGQAEDVQLLLFGKKSANAAITRFQVRRSLLDPIGYQVFVEVANFSDRPLATRLEFDLDDEVVDVVPLELEPEGRTVRVIEQTSAAGGRLVARIDHQDVLSADNRAVAVLPERKKQPVLLVTEGSLFLQRVFEAMPTVDLRVADSVLDPLPNNAVVVLHRRTPEALPPGNVLVIDPLQSCPPWTVGGLVEHPIVTDQDTESPLMTHVRLDNVLMPEARSLRIGAPHHVLAASVGGDPLYVSVEQAEGKLLVLSVNLSKGDLPLRTAFPIMMTNALNWFQDSRGELREAAAAGSLAEVDLGALDWWGEAAGPLTLRAPDGTAKMLPGGADSVTVGPLDQCGVWTVGREPPDQAAPSDSSDQAQLQLACNLANSAESDLRCPLDRPETSHAALAGLGARPIWFYLIAAAAVLIVFEWCLYQRRWIS